MSDPHPLIGAIVRDQDDDDPDPARVVNIPDKRADEWEIRDGQTCADHPSNEGYDGAAPVVVVVFEDDLQDHGLGDWSTDDPLDLAQLADQSVPHYAFPAPRLEAIAIPEAKHS